MREHPPGDRRELAPLFDRQETLRAVVDAVLEGRLGRAWSSTEASGAARLSLGCYEIFGGRADPSPLESSRAESNPISQRLAVRLGLSPSGTCAVLLLS